MNDGLPDLPDYQQLPLAMRGGRSAWGLFGGDDNLGMLNVLTPELTRSASELIVRGEVVPLDLPLDHFSPPLFERSAYRIDMSVTPDGQGLDETYHDFNPQSSSQWDALGHVAYDLDAFYNAATQADVLVEGRNTIGHWARRGIATRGVLLDVKLTAETNGRAYSPGTAHAFSVSDLEEARVAAGVEYQVGDVLLLRTGFVDWYDHLDGDGRLAISKMDTMRACGLEHTEAMAEYLWNTHAVAVASDSPALEVWPMERGEDAYPFGMLHRFILGQFGMGIGELWALDPLAARCRDLGRNEFFLASSPLNSRLGIGSPANAMAIL